MGFRARKSLAFGENMEKINIHIKRHRRSPRKVITNISKGPSLLFLVFKCQKCKKPAAGVKVNGLKCRKKLGLFDKCA